MRIPTIILCLFIFFAAPTAHANKAVKKIQVTSTIGQLDDLVRAIGGNRVQARHLMGPGVDPHLYRASASDLIKLKEAQIIFYLGLKLEGKMDEVFSKMRSKDRPVIAVGESVPKNLLLKPKEFSGAYDPHIWFDIDLWMYVVDAVAAGLTSIDKPAEKFYLARAKRVKAELDQLKKWGVAKVSDLAKAKRILITSHDAFNYFGRAFGFIVVGLQGISTVSEAGLADMAKLTDYIKKYKVKALFVESSVSRKAIERVSRDAGVKIGGEIFSDAMGVPGDIVNDYDRGTYEGMIKHNINTIVSSLK